MLKDLVTPELLYDFNKKMKSMDSHVRVIPNKGHLATYQIIIKDRFCTYDQIHLVPEFYDMLKEHFGPVNFNNIGSVFWHFE